MRNCKPTVDHLGNHFVSKQEMCDHWNVCVRTYENRIRRGWSLKNALECQSKHDAILDEERGFVKRHGCYIDHLGNPYRSIEVMCRCWHVGCTTFYKRYATGCDLKTCLTGGNSDRNPDKDKSIIWVFNVPFAKYSDVDVAYGYSAGMASEHKDDLEQWLNGKGRFFIDDKVFNSLSELAGAYGLTESCIHYRLEKYGWTLTDAVHTPVKNAGNTTICYDHLGNKYPSKKAMVQHYDMRYSTYMSRICQGWSIEKALTTPINKHKLNNTKIACDI